MASKDNRFKVAVVSRCAWTLYNFRRNLMTQIAAKGHEVLAFGAELDGCGERLIDEGRDYTPIRVPLRGLAPIGDLRLFVELFFRFSRLRPTIFHGFTIKPVIYGTLAAALARVPRRVCTITGLGHAFTEGGGLLRTIAETLYRVALAKAHVVFFQNAEDRELFVVRRLVDPSKTRVVSGSGVDLAKFERRPYRAGLGYRPVRFLMLSRLLREKGVLEYVAAADELRKAGVNSEFRLVGAEDTRNPTALDKSEIARLQASPVEWIGPVDDVRAELEAADVVVLPSYREGTPRSLLEAMATGRPIITTDAPGCRHLVIAGVNGLLVQPKDAPSLAAAMAKFAAAPEKITGMGEAARDFVCSNYDEARVIAETISAYELGATGR